MKHLDEEKKFTMGIAYTIALLFFVDLTLLRKEASPLNEEEWEKTDEGFFFVVCEGGEEGEEWVDAVIRTGKPLNINLASMPLSEKEVFLAATQFAKIFDERPEVEELSALVRSLEAMHQTPEAYPEYWTLWGKTKAEVIRKNWEIRPMPSIYDCIASKIKRELGNANNTLFSR